MKTANSTHLDFDYLTELARSNPSEFERLRQAAIEDYIAALPTERQQRMRRLQWRIDQERRNHSPMGACLKLSRMMWDHLLGPGGLVVLMKGDRVDTPRSGKVIPFPVAQRS